MIFFQRNALGRFGSTALFVLLWSSGAIFSEIGLGHAAPLVFLILRFALALAALLPLCLWQGRWLPPRGMRWRVALTGLLLSGAYSICYLLALDHGVTPGLLATVLGVQPILTLLLLERSTTWPRRLGLVLALGGLACVVYGGLGTGHLGLAGLILALAALVCMTSGAILQKGLALQPLQVLPLQYAVSLLLCLALAPFDAWHVDVAARFLFALVWLGLVISVAAQLLFYRLIQAGNLVNVTSLFYLVPAVTAVMDRLLLGHRLPLAAWLGMLAILLGVMQVYRSASPAESVLKPEVASR